MSRASAAWQQPLYRVAHSFELFDILDNDCAFLSESEQIVLEFGGSRGEQLVDFANAFLFGIV